MNAFEQYVLKTIDKYHMIEKGSTVVAAVSGGYDSMCMLAVLHSLKNLREYDVCAVHINHMLRDTAGEDEEFVRSYAEKLGIKAYTKKADVSAYAEKNKISFETAGRILRYEYFNEIAGMYEKSVIATAHNANDSAESMLMHLMRGSGLSGLSGIRPVNGRIIRPLAEADRESIEKYCEENNIPHRHDVTNDSDDYKRNDIRHNVLPPMLERCSLLSLTRTMNIISDDDSFLEQAAASAFSDCVRTECGRKLVNLKKFNNLHVSLRRRVVRTALEKTDGENQVCLVHIDEILKMAERAVGGKHTRLPGGRIVRIEKGELVI